MKWPLLIAFFIPLLAQASLREAEVLRAMARFDEGFVPLWVHVQEGRWCEAEDDIFRLEFHWQRLLHDYLAEGGSLPDWACNADQDLGRAYRAVDAGRLADASRLLDGVRRALQDYRSAQGLTYYLDPWWNAWDAVQAPAGSPSAALACTVAEALDILSMQRLSLKWTAAEQQALSRHQARSAAMARRLNENDETLAREERRALIRHLLNGFAILGRVGAEAPRYAAT